VEAILTGGQRTRYAKGKPVTLRGVGTWQVRAKRARVGPQPKTGAPAAIPPAGVVRFTAGKVLKQAVTGAPTALSPKLPC